uniref:AIPR family protein n=2 Tax=Megasphaera sp. TaxID=2023260 RepID=UPI0040289A7B
MKEIINFRVNMIRTLPSPYQKRGETGQFETIYYLLVNMKDLPNNIPLDVNPRKPKMTTHVAKNLLNAVVEPETDFYINNRGIVIAAKSLVFNSQKSEVTIDLGDQELDDDKYSYGILDGGHTYTAIMKKRKAIPPDIEKYVRLEVITNVQNITRLSDARNTSVQVSDIALFNLDDNFVDVKSAISNELYSNNIAYKDNENKDINVSELLRLMYAFDIEKYPDDSTAPVQSYSGKAQVFKRYKEAFANQFYKTLTKKIPVLTNLYDLIEYELPSFYKAYKEKAGIKNSRFGSVKGVESLQNGKTIKTSFLHYDQTYNISAGFIYPIFGAFRCLLRFDKDKGTVNWIFNPIQMWKNVGESLAQNTFETQSNPQLAGKDKQLWLSNYRIVETQSLRMLLQKNNTTQTP